VTTVTQTRLYGTARARAWHRLHPRLTRRAAWADCPDLPILHGTVIRLDVQRLPSGATAKPLWLWAYDPHDTGAADLSIVDLFMTGVPAPLRHRAHLPAVQADPRLDGAETA
jgi:hypothetical protein